MLLANLDLEILFSHLEKPPMKTTLHQDGMVSKVREKNGNSFKLITSH